ncbi:MAG: 8-oxo-dGTP diphosphatase MutT [Pseudomonadota bacterium]
MTGKPTIRVAAGILINAQRIFIAQRVDGRHGVGLWEFPGGKIESGESAEQALQRELEEELGVMVTAAEPALTHQHEYPERVVRLEFFVVKQWSGEPTGREGQPVMWCPFNELAARPWMPANQCVLDWLRENVSADI